MNVNAIHGAKSQPSAPIKPTQRDPDLRKHDPEDHHEDTVPKHRTMRHEEDLFLGGGGCEVRLIDIIHYDGADSDEFGRGGGGNREEEGD